MKRKIKVFFFYCLGFYVGCYNTESELGKAVRKNYDISINHKIVYVKASMWGMTGDHIQIFFSRFPFKNASFDSNTCIKYFEPTIYYKIINDTLELYSTMKTEIPKSFDSAIKIRQVIINRLDDINRYRKKYKEYGLNKISVFE